MVHFVEKQLEINSPTGVKMAAVVRRGFICGSWSGFLLQVRVAELETAHCMRHRVGDVDPVGRVTGQNYTPGSNSGRGKGHFYG